MIRQFTQVGDTVLIVEETSSGAFLYAYPKHGMAGDTWHRTIAEAKEQADVQFGSANISWLPVPAEVTDLRTYARQVPN